MKAVAIILLVWIMFSFGDTTALVTGVGAIHLYRGRPGSTKLMLSMALVIFLVWLALIIGSKLLLVKW